MNDVHFVDYFKLDLIRQYKCKLNLMVISRYSVCPSADLRFQNVVALDKQFLLTAKLLFTLSVRKWLLCKNRRPNAININIFRSNFNHFNYYESTLVWIEA